VNVAASEASGARLQDRVAIVTGAGSGIGRGIALRFAREGARVCCADINPASAEETTALVRGIGPAAIAVEVDVRVQDHLDAMVARAEAELGAPWVCVANAGVIADSRILTATREDWERVIGVNLTGAFFTLQAATRAMVKAGRGGRLIAMSSVVAEKVAGGANAYGASKAAVRHMTRSIAQEVARYGITANSIGPAYAISNMAPWMSDPAYLDQLARDIPLGRVGRPEDVAAVAAFLASDEAAFITGGFYLVDGGAADAPWPTPWTGGRWP
jgi:NAD(P)-dependent dehydrogenase (short-subunit alcohol dehydrogenase family)